VSAKARLDVNVALNRPSYQVSDWGANPASNANDGSHSTDDINVGCAITEVATNPWWAVDLSVTLYVYGVKFTNRNGWGISAIQFRVGFQLSRVECTFIHRFIIKIIHVAHSTNHKQTVGLI